MQQVYKIVILGTSGAGKSTLAKKIANHLSIHHIELDQLYWNPNWVETPIDQFLDKINQEINLNNEWVICGNYHAAKNVTLPNATHIIWLNYSFIKVFYRSFKRTIYRILSAKEPFPGCKETFFKSFFSSKSILWWVITTYKSRKMKLTKLLVPQNFPNAIIFDIKNNQDYQNCITSFNKIQHN